MKSITTLSPKEQRIIIDRCMTAKSLTCDYKDELYQLPKFIQLTYHCRNTKCSRTYNARVYSADIIDKSGFASQIKCPNCRKQAIISNKGSPMKIPTKPTK
ncbi:MAG: hypothetical protein ACXAC2_00475 [Candidatus Kariarchaeaceae archaeon]|jgi:hypothetical protein